MTQAAKVLDRVRYILKDEDVGSYRWTDTELLMWLSDVQRQIVQIRPDANPKVANFTTVAGARQTLPADSWQLLDVIRNNTSGRPVVRITKTSYDMGEVEAYKNQSATVAYNYYYEPENRFTFYLTPAVGAGVVLEIVYAKIPDEIVAKTTVIEVSDIYINAIVSGVLSYAYMKDEPYAANHALAQAHRTAFYQAISLGANDGDSR